jgi:hypothetical protein
LIISQRERNEVKRIKREIKRNRTTNMIRAAELIDEQDERADRDEHRKRLKTERKNVSWVMMVSELGEWGELYTG